MVLLQVLEQIAVIFALISAFMALTAWGKH